MRETGGGRAPCVTVHHQPKSLSNVEKRRYILCLSLVTLYSSAVPIGACPPDPLERFESWVWREDLSPVASPLSLLSTHARSCSLLPDSAPRPTMP